MKLGLTTKHYPNHGTVIVPCDSQGNALGDNVFSVDVKDGLVTVKYHIDESMIFEGAKSMRWGHHHYSISSEPDITADAVREIVRDELAKMAIEMAKGDEK